MELRSKFQRTSQDTELPVRPGDVSEVPIEPGEQPALSFITRTPDVITRQLLPRRAPLELLTAYEKWNVAGHLTFTEAIRLMLASKDMHAAIRQEPLLAQVSCAFESQRRVQLARELARASNTALVRDVPAASRLQQLRSAAAQALHPGRSRRAEERDVQGGRAEQRPPPAPMQESEAEIEALVFHFAVERMNGPRAANSLDASAQACAVTNIVRGKLHTAIDGGNVKVVRACLREFLSLSPTLIPNARKVAWLREAKGTCTLKFFGQYPCGKLSPQERRQYEAITAYVDEIVTSEYLSLAEKSQLCVRLELPRHDMASGANVRVELDVVRHAIGHNNPAVAAAILLGIHESGAHPEVKQFLLRAIASAPQELGQLVDGICAMLGKHEPRSPDWVNAVVRRLKRVGKLES